MRGNRWPVSLLLAASAIALMGLASCGGGGGGNPGPPPGIVVTVNPNPGAVEVGKTLQFSAVVTNASNTAVTWSVDGGASNGSVNNAGLYTAPATAGSYAVRGTSVADPSKSGTATVNVTTTPPTGGRAEITVTGLPSLALSVKNSLTLPGVGIVVDLITERQADGSLPVTVFADVPEGSAPTSLAAYSQHGAAGVVMARGSQNIAITRGNTTKVNITLTSVITQVVVTPANPPAINVGATVQLAAVAQDGGGTTIPTKPLLWQVGNPAVASVSQTGLVTGVAPGTTNITATDSESGKNGRVSVTVNPPTLPPGEVSLGAFMTTNQDGAGLEDTIVSTLADSTSISAGSAGLFRTFSGPQGTGTITNSRDMNLATPLSAVTADGRIWAPSYIDGKLYVLDKTLATVRTIPVGSLNKATYCVQNGLVYLSGAAGLAELDPSTYNLRWVRSGAGNWTGCAASDGKHIYYQTSDGVIWQINQDPGNPGSPTNLGTFGLCYALNCPNGWNLAVGTDTTNRTVMRMKLDGTTTGYAAMPFPGGSMPLGIGTDFRNPATSISFGVRGVAGHYPSTIVNK